MWTYPLEKNTQGKEKGSESKRLRQRRGWKTEDWSGLHKEIQRGQVEKTADIETYSGRAEEKLKWKQADNKEGINHQLQTDREHQGECSVKTEWDKIKASCAPSCGSQQNSLAETLNNNRDQRLRGYTYLMAHCCTLLAMKLPPFWWSQTVGSFTNAGNKTELRESREETKREEREGGEETRGGNPRACAEQGQKHGEKGGWEEINDNYREDLSG